MTQPADPASSDWINDTRTAPDGVSGAPGVLSASPHGSLSAVQSQMAVTAHF